MYYAIIGDLVASRSYEDRLHVQEKLKYNLNEINREYSNEIGANFLITLGDEFQGLLTQPLHLFPIIDKIRFSMYPVKIRIGIGIGNINTEIDRSQAIGADGPAYHFARKMIEEIRKDEISQQRKLQDIKIASQQEDKYIELINSNLSLCTCLENSWTQKQFETIDLILYKNISQKEAAKRLGISASSIQRRLNSAHYFNYKFARELVGKILLGRWKGIDAK
ncbi:MAG: SatD family protein [Clostridiaceae bacterium]|nr:SatD family protein [Clostridiaceae bacterium]